MIQHLDDLVAKAKARGKRRLIVAYGQDSHTLEAVNDAVEAGIVDATLVGNPEEIEKVCKAEGIDMSRFTIVAENVDVNCVRIAVQMVSEGKGDVLMKGLVSTDKYMRGILNKEFGLVPPKGVLSHVTVMEIPALPQAPDHRRRGGPSLRISHRKRPLPNISYRPPRSWKSTSPRWLHRLRASSSCPACSLP